MAVWVAPAIAAGAAYLGSRMNADATADANNANMAMQQKFAQRGIQWKVKDAQKAGIHPLYAMGAQTHMPSAMIQPDHSLGNAVADMGQDIGRAISSQATDQEKQLAAIQLQSAQLDIEGKTLDNQYRAAQLKNLSLNTPSMPSAAGNFIPGQGNSGIAEKAMERTASHGSNPGVEPGAINSLGYTYQDGVLTPVQSKDAKERLEDSPGELMHYLRNNILPNFGSKSSVPPVDPGKGKHWEWSVGDQGWKAVPNGGRTWFDSWQGKGKRNSFSGK